MRYIKLLFSPLLMGVLFIVFAVAMAVATFLENDYGSPAAFGMVYNNWWFELILLLLAANLVGQVIAFNLLRREKLTVALFHLSFIIMIIGAGITRYFGWEGSIHIREGTEQRQCFSNEKYISYEVRDLYGNLLVSNARKYSLTSVYADYYNESFKVSGRNYELILSKIIPNATEKITDSPGGEPIVSFLLTKSMMATETVTLRKGDKKSAGGLSFSFDSARQADLNISLDSGKFFMVSRLEIGQRNMTTGDVMKCEAGRQVELIKAQVLTVNDVKIMPQQMSAEGVINAIGVKPEIENTGINAFIFHLISGRKTETIYLWSQDDQKITSDSLRSEDNTFRISYGSKKTTLPFSVKLNDFILERYPGSSSPSGYKSNVVLIDKAENIEKPFTIFMNNILKYKGYRFYQSSYDRDEKGTVLSVNNDMAGMIVTFTGYGLLFLFIILSLFNRKSLFHTLNAGHWNSLIRKTIPSVLLILLPAWSSTINAQKLIPERNAAAQFGKVLVQDQKGRTKPLFTLSNDILRKVTRESKFEGLTSMQVFLGLYFDFGNWKDVPLIRISDSDLRRKLGVSGKLASFSDLINISDGTYKISDAVSEAYSKAPGERSRSDKELMKVDERVNIVYMISKGDFLKLFPLKDGTHNWGSPQEALIKASGREDSIYLSDIIPVLAQAVRTNNLTKVIQVSESVKGYQNRFSQYSLPASSRTSAELLYNNLNIFESLFPYYATLGFIMLIGLIALVIRGRRGDTKFIRVFRWLLFTGFLLHTFGLGLRWYIAGHAPMSNGYESMTFISWAILLAGFVFSRKSSFALSAAAVLASMTLMVAHMSFMDPEITNLVPVLKSYWLTLHVSVIISSDGFLGVGAILSLINLILISFSNSKNRVRISETIDELTVITFKTLAIGLYLLTIGTFLGAVWANESWGRYWGWDPKETWSLITIIIYSIVIHSRRIPGMNDIFTFNLISLFAFASVLMTYFGVNYYLSGMHSYASGDPLPVPTFVYIAVIALAALSLLAYSKYRRSSI